MTETDRFKVYLAGPIMFADDGGHGWRDNLIRYWPDVAEWVNPLDEKDGSSEELTILPEGVAEDYSPVPGEEVVTDAEVVEDDKRLIRQCDAIFVGYPDATLTWGTPQEQIYAYAREIPTYTWHRDLDWLEDCSPWLRYHTEYHAQNRDDVVEQMVEDL